MSDTEAPPLAAPALFDVSPPPPPPPADPAGTLVRVALDDLELAPNARREIDPEGIERLAFMLMAKGQLVPCIGHRPTGCKVTLFASQRRLLAARKSHELV